MPVDKIESKFTSLRAKYICADTLDGIIPNNTTRARTLTIIGFFYFLLSIIIFRSAVMTWVKSEKSDDFLWLLACAVIILFSAIMCWFGADYIKKWHLKMTTNSCRLRTNISVIRFSFRDIYQVTYHCNYKTYKIYKTREQVIFSINSLLAESTGVPQFFLYHGIPIQILWDNPGGLTGGRKRNALLTVINPWRDNMLIAADSLGQTSDNSTTTNINNSCENQ